MARTVIILNNPILKVATSQAGLTSGTSVECQVTSAIFNAAPNYSTIPSTGCAGATQSPGLTSYALDLAWLNDWGATPTGLSQFAWDNDGKSVWVELTPDSAQATKKVTANCYATAGTIGGVFGDGSPTTSTATWPCVAKPTIALSTALDADAAAVDDDATADAA